jgi:hypothetical protein
MESSIKKAQSIDKIPFMVHKTKLFLLNFEKSEGGTNKRIKNNKDCSYMFGQIIDSYVGSDFSIPHHQNMSYTNPLKIGFGGY